MNQYWINCEFQFSTLGSETVLYGYIYSTSFELDLVDITRFLRNHLELKYKDHLNRPDQGIHFLTITNINKL